MGEVSGTGLHELGIEPMGARLRVSADKTLLASALAASIELPRSCRNGTCRTCLCRLVSGQVAYRIEWPGLSAEEKHDGYILPCVAYPLSDVVIMVSGAKRVAASSAT